MAGQGAQSRTDQHVINMLRDKPFDFILRIVVTDPILVETALRGFIPSAFINERDKLAFSQDIEDMRRAEGIYIELIFEAGTFSLAAEDETSSKAQELRKVLEEHGFSLRGRGDEKLQMLQLVREALSYELVILNLDLEDTSQRLRILSKK